MEKCKPLPKICSECPHCYIETVNYHTYAHCKLGDMELQPFLVFGKIDSRCPIEDIEPELEPFVEFMENWRKAREESYGEN